MELIQSISARPMLHNEAGRFDCSAPPAPPSDYIPLSGVGHDAPFNLDGLMSNDGTFIDCIVGGSCNRMAAWRRRRANQDPFQGQYADARR
jgi:hypothetical protein